MVSGCLWTFLQMAYHKNFLQDVYNSKRRKTMGYWMLEQASLQSRHIRFDFVLFLPGVYCLGSGQPIDYTHIPPRWCGLRDQPEVSMHHLEPSCWLLVLVVITTAFCAGLPGCSSRTRWEGECPWIPSSKQSPYFQWEELCIIVFTWQFYSLN